MSETGVGETGTFGNRVRVRVNGLIVRNRALLLLKLKSPTRDTPFWIPPGGGVELGESLEETLSRELLEETGLRISGPELWYISEYINKPWHAVEFYFFCRNAVGNLHLGSDPELDSDRQFILDGAFLPFDQLSEIPLVPHYLKSKFIRDYQNERKGPEFIPWHDETR